MRRRVLSVFAFFAAIAACANTSDSETASGNQDETVADDGQGVGSGPGAGPTVKDVQIRLLSDMVTSRTTMAEWGFSALVTITQNDGSVKKVLFDTGGSPNLVLENAEKLVKIGMLAEGELCSITDVVLSHNHADHTTGLVSLRNQCATTNPKAFTTAHVGGPEIFWPRPLDGGGDDNAMVAMKATYEAAGGHFEVDDKPGNLAGIPGVYLTGKIDRPHDEKTYPGTPNFVRPDGSKGNDIIPEEHALVINTAQGIVVVTGCAHAGIVNTIEAARKTVGGNPGLVAAIGGIHTIASPIGNATQEGSLTWFGAELHKYRPQFLLGSHCTGLERLPFLRDKLKLDDRHAIFTTVATGFSLSGGISRPSPNLNNPLSP